MKLSHDKDFGLLLLRLVLSFIFIMAGYAKLTHIGDTIGFFGSIGLAPQVAYFIGWLELVGGISFLFGYATKVFAALLSAVLFVAIFKVHLANGFGAAGGIDFPFAALGGTLALTFAGAGRYGFGADCGCPVGKGSCKMCVDDAVPAQK
jgi:putative oxidoreductase